MTNNIPANVKIHNKHLSAYADHIKADYAGVGKRCNIREEMIKEFNESLSFEVGSSYIKVVTGSSVHSFIVIKPSAKFPVGTILKAASWKAPAKNFARGNVLNKTFDRIRWTGAM